MTGQYIQPYYISSGPPPVQMEQRLRNIADEGAPGNPISYFTPIAKPPGMAINYEHNESVVFTN